MTYRSRIIRLEQFYEKVRYNKMKKCSCVGCISTYAVYGDGGVHMDN